MGFSQTRARKSWLAGTCTIARTTGRVNEHCFLVSRMWMPREHTHTHKGQTYTLPGTDTAHTTHTHTAHNKHATPGATLHRRVGGEGPVEQGGGGRRLPSALCWENGPAIYLPPGFAGQCAEMIAAGYPCADRCVATVLRANSMNDAVSQHARISAVHLESVRQCLLNTIPAVSAWPRHVPTPDSATKVHTCVMPLFAICAVKYSTSKR